MTLPPKPPPRDLNFAHLQSSVDRSFDEMDRLQAGLKEIRRQFASTGEVVQALTSKVARLERQSHLSVSSNTPDLAADRPVPRDPANPTDVEIRKHALYQLFHTGCWNGKHTSREHLRRGYMAKVEQRRIWVVVGHLQSEGLLLPHGKSSEEQYSLNPAKADQIYRELGISARPTDTRANPPTSTTGPSPADADRVPDDPGTFVGVGRFENTVRSIRSEVEANSRAVSNLSEGLSNLTRSLAELGSRVDARFDQLQAEFDAANSRSSPERPAKTGDPPVDLQNLQGPEGVGQ